MKTTVMILVLFTLFSINTFTQDSPQWGLPDGVKVRLGKGEINEIQYSPDGTLLAVVSSIGVWLYDTATYREVALLTGHTGRVSSVSFSPDGRTIASGSWKEIRLWDAVTGRHIRTLTGHTGSVRSVSFSSDGRTIASVSLDDTISLWDMVKGVSIGTITVHTESVRSPAVGIREVAFSPDTNRIATASWGTRIKRDGVLQMALQLWDTNTGTRIRTLTGHTELVDSLVFSPDGRTMASGSRDATIRLWDALTGAHIRTLTGHEGAVVSVVFSPDGRTMASGSGDGTVRIWNARIGVLLNTLKHPSYVRTSYHWPSQTVVKRISEQRVLVNSVSFSSDGRTIASGSSDDTIRLWDVVTGEHIHTLTAHTDRVYSVSFSPDGRTLASGSEDAIIRLWDALTGAHIRTLTGHTGWVNSVSFSPDGRTIASGSWDATIRLWDALTGENIRTLEGYPAPVNSVSFSPDGRTIASGSSDDTIRLWDALTGENIRTLTGHIRTLFYTDSVSSVSFSPDGRTIASGSGDATIRLWDALTGENIRTLEGYPAPVNSVSFSPDGRTIASGSSDDTIRLWDAVTSRHIRALAGHTGWVNSVSFSPDGRTIASGSSDDTIRLWDAVTGRHIRALAGHTDSVSSVSFSPDGRTIASGSDDGTILLWELAPSVHTNSTVSILTSPVPSPGIGAQLTISLKITDGANVAGYQATVAFDTSALRYVESANGDYLPTGAFFVPPIVSGNKINLAATSLSGESNGDGILATVTFEVIAVKASTLTLSDVILSDSGGTGIQPQVENGEVVEPPQLKEDLNRDGVVNIQDLVLIVGQFGQTGANDADMNGDGVVNIQDLVLIVGAFGNTAAAPSFHPQALALLTAADIQDWLTQAQQMALTDPIHLRGIAVLEQLLVALTPKETVLLPNYPNPFNPETWIPYHLAHAADVQITIYDTNGVMVRQLDLGYQSAGYYTDRSKAAYWDGRNENGESVASGVYFYQLQAKNYSAMRRMVIVK